MHIEGPPRVDRPWREYGDVVDHLRAWFEGRVELARELGVAEEQIAIDPGLDFDLSTDQDLEILRRLGELRALGLPLYVSLSRKDFIGAVLAGSWEGRWPAGEREWGTVAAAALAVRDGADILRLHDRSSLQAMRVPRIARVPTGRAGLCREIGPSAGWGRGDGARRLASGAPWSVAIDPARRDGRIVAESSEAERQARPVSLPAAPRPRLRRGAGARPGSSASTRTSSPPTRPPPPRTWSSPAAPPRARASPSTCRCSTASPATPKRRALYLYPTKALAQDQARKLAQLRPPRLREAIYDGDTPKEERPAIRRRSNLVLTNPDMLHVGLLPHHKSWGDFLANLRWVVVDEAHTYRGVFGSHVANVLRRLRRVARAYGSEPRFLLASATIANPVELAERLVGTAVRAGRRRRRAARRPRGRDVEPAADRQGERARGARRSRRPPTCWPSSSPRGCGRSASSKPRAGSS